MATETSENYSIVGKRPIRHDGADKVTGKALYGADTNLPGMLYGKVLRSPHAHAIIKSIDLSEAVTHPNVRALVTSEDLAPLPDKNSEIGEDLYANAKYVRDRILASDKVLFKGHPIVAIAADSVHEAEELLDLIKIEYQVLPSVTDVESAMADDAPILHETIKTASISGDVTSHSNIASHEQYVLGNIDKGFLGKYKTSKKDKVSPCGTKKIMFYMGFRQSGRQNNNFLTRISRFTDVYKGFIICINSTLPPNFIRVLAISGGTVP